MEITKKAEYAVRALVELALHPNEYISSKEIAQKQGYLEFSSPNYCDVRCQWMESKVCEDLVGESVF